jgi:putative transposase
MMRGLSTRNYAAVVKEFRNAYGIEKSAVSENFIEASREKVFTRILSSGSEPER